MEKESSSPPYLLWDKRKVLLPAALCASLILGILLLSCGGQAGVLPETGPEAVQESTVGPSPTPTPVPWCDPEEDFYEELDNLGDLAAEGIQMEVCITGGKGDFQFDPEIPDLVENPPPLDVDDPFPIAALVAYLKILDSEEFPVTNFSPGGLKIRIIYTETAWNLALQNETAASLGRPRLAYLVWVDAWIEPWVEFDAVDDFPPGSPENPPGVGILIITLDELPDPLIGDC